MAVTLLMLSSPNTPEIRHCSSGRGPRGHCGRGDTICRRTLTSPTSSSLPFDAWAACVPSAVGICCARAGPPRRAVVAKKTAACAWARRAGSAPGRAPRSLPGSNVTIGCFSDRPDALTCHPGRGNSANLAAEGVPKALTTRRWPAAMTPRRAALRADDAVASHRAADGAGFPIKGARTHAHATSRGAVAGFPAFRSAIPCFLRPAEQRVCLNAASPTSDFCLSKGERVPDRIAVLTDYVPFESGRRSFCP